MEEPPITVLDRGHGRPARHDPSPSAGCRCHTPMIWFTGVPPAWSFAKRARRPFPLGFSRSYSRHTPANARVWGLPSSSHPWPTPKERYDPKAQRKPLLSKNQMATPRREPAPSSPAPKRTVPDRASRSNCHHRNLGRVELPSSGGNESSQRLGQVPVKSPFHGCCDPSLRQ